MFDSLQTFFAYLDDVHTREFPEPDVDRLEDGSQSLGE